MSNKFLIIFATTFVVYFVIDFVFNNVMLYVVGGIVVGSIEEVFNAIGIKAGMALINLIWAALLIGIVILFYRLNSNIWKYILVVFIAVLLYIIDVLVAIIPYDYMPDTKNIIAISNIIIGVLVLLKSVILSWIIYTGISKK